MRLLYLIRLSVCTIKIIDDRGVDDVVEIRSGSLEVLVSAIDGDSTAPTGDEVVNVLALDVVVALATLC
jgi:hypothetical protein